MFNNAYEQKRFKVFSLNVNGWKTNGRAITNIIHREDPDVVLLSEHGIKDSENLKLFNYTVIKKNLTSERFDGAAVAIRKNIKFKTLPSCDESYVAVSIACGLQDLILVAGYQPPRRDYLPLHDIIPLFNRHAPVMYAGDLNSRTTASGYRTTNGAGRNLDMLIDRNIVDRIGPTFPTFYTGRSATKPDIVLVNRKFTFNYFIEPGPITPSDHVAMTITISTSPIQVPVTKRKAYGKADWDLYRAALRDFEPSNLERATPEELDQELERLQTALVEADNRAVPKTTYKTLPHPVTTQTMKTIEQRYEEVVNTIQMHGPSIEKMRNLRQLKIQYREEILREKDKLWNNLLETIDKDKNPKTFWRSIKRMTGPPRPSMLALKDDDGESYQEPEDQERILREHWKEIFKITEEENQEFDYENEERVLQHLEGNIEKLSPYHQVEEQRVTEEEKITKEEVLQTIQSFKQRAPGTSGLTKRNFTEAPENIVEGVTSIYNTALNLGYFPDYLKISKMIFIQKEGKPPDSVKSYRPISLLEFIAKVFEKILNNKLVDHLVRTEGYSDMQHGFRAGRGTDTALAVICESIANAKAKGQRIDVVLRDVQKAFDKVWTQGMQYKILQLGLSSHIERILCDYVVDRKSYININTFNGPHFDLEAGVPQGGCLSPTLYSVYTADLPAPGHHLSTTVQFADDITQVIISENPSVNLMAIRTANEIARINKYENQWKIRTNTEKFKIIPISRLKTGDVLVNGDLYPYTREGRVLGLTLTSTGYKKHVVNRVNQARARLPTLFKLRNISIKNKQKIYTALIRSVLLYPPVPLVSVSPTSVMKLQRVQNSALYLITNTRRREYRTIESMHKQIDMETINITLKNRAANIWEKMLQLMSLQTLNQLIPPHQNEMYYIKRFPSTRLAAKQNQAPIYT